MNSVDPIQVPNRKLAEAMLSCGCEVEDISNQYTPGLLRDRKLIGAGPITEEKFERRVIEVAQGKMQGSVIFFMRRTSRAESVIAAWDGTAKLIQMHREREAMSAEEKKDLDPPPPLPNIPDEIVAQVLCMHANNAKVIPQLIFSAPPICNTLKGETQKTGETSTGAQAGVTTGAGKIWSVMLDDESRLGVMKLKLKHKRLIKEWINPYAP